MIKCTYLKPALSLLAGVGLTVQAYAGIPVIDGANVALSKITSMEAVVQTVKQAEEYAMQIQQYQKQLQQYENMIQNTVAPAAYIWDQANSTINKLMSAQDMLNYYTSQAGSLDSYLDKFQNIGYYRSSPCYQSTGCSAEDRAALERNEDLQSDSIKEANAAMFKGIEQQQQNLKSDARQLERLQAAASTADGQVKAIQYANQLASQQANQLLQIRGLMIAQQNALAAQAAAKQDQDAREKAAERNMTSGSYRKSTPEVW
ncbi:P-type conjugative transfer protein TrbJ [Pseudomonas sp. NBRC 111119]|uniref:P-type conjugative transfer protein TrbJ n=1 Tax=Pseudomonas sp. NBRC 111119 TaxID=1661034 RepID=UPI000A8FCFCB|nr:P-type conjugative transfer protein TrbJ [Pseudomonas sp. NBRC 111119]